MKADVGDRLVIRGFKSEHPDRDGKIVEIRGVNGEPPYMVKWEFDGHVALIYPGSDAYIEHFEHESETETGS